MLRQPHKGQELVGPHERRIDEVAAIVVAIESPWPWGTVARTMLMWAPLPSSFHRLGPRATRVPSRRGDHKNHTYGARNPSRVVPHLTRLPLSR